MPRPCGPCSDTRRNELDRRLLNKEIIGESFRRIVDDFGYSETALRRHLSEHLTIDLVAVKTAKEEARRNAAEEAHAAELDKTLAEIKTEVKGSTASRLENAANFLDQLREVRRRAAALLDQAEAEQDLRACGTFLKELREQIRLWAELEGKLATQPQINITLNAEWIGLRTTIVTALEPYPQAREAVLRAIE